MGNFFKVQQCPTCKHVFHYDESRWFEVCPRCGGWGEFMSGRFFGWPTYPVRRVYTPNPNFVWWKPSTWVGTIHFEGTNGNILKPEDAPRD